MYKLVIIREPLEIRSMLKGIKCVDYEFCEDRRSFGHESFA